MVVQKDFQKTRLIIPAERLLAEAPVDPMSLLIGTSALNLRQAKKEVVRKLSRFCEKFVKKGIV
jgi:hypothetical protein